MRSLQCTGVLCLLLAACGGENAVEWADTSVSAMFDEDAKDERSFSPPGGPSAGAPSVLPAVSGLLTNPLCFTGQNVAGDARDLLSLLKSRAALQAGKSDKDAATSALGVVYENAEPDYDLELAAQGVQVTLKETGLPKEKFYAASIYLGAIIQRTEFSKDLQVWFNQGPDRVELRAIFSPSYKFYNPSADKRPAPIGQVSFDAIEKADREFAALIRNGWQDSYPSVSLRRASPTVLLLNLHFSKLCERFSKNSVTIVK